MPKKQKQKQKQKQSQKTSVVVNVGTSKKSSKKSAPAPVRMPSSISVILQGSTMNLPAPPTQDYNRMVQELDFMRRQQASSGSLIPQMARNDLLNRVQATNPFSVRSTNTQTEMLNPYEGLVEEQVDAEITSNAYDNNTDDAEIPIDQDFIRQSGLKRFSQNLGSFIDKIGVVEDIENIPDLVAYDDEDLEDRLAKSVEKNDELELLEQVKLQSEKEAFMTDDEREKLIKKMLAKTPQQHQERVKKFKQESLNKEYEDFVKAEAEKNKYLTPRMKDPPLRRVEDSETSKKEKALRRTAEFIKTAKQFEEKSKPKGRPKKTEK